VTATPSADVPAADTRRLGPTEFTSLLAMSMALAALGIDLMLPAFGAIRADLGLAADSTAVAGLVTTYFIGLAVGQLAYGPLADRYGRKPTLYLGYAIYAGAALFTTFAPTLPLLLIGRLFWGIGAAGPRVVTMAVIRDRYEGEQMSRAMSFVMAVFILVPVIAPALGAAVVAVASWRWVFGVCVVAAGVMAVWALRLPETLHPDHRLELKFGRVLRAARYVVSNRRTAAYTLAQTALYGVFTSYLASSEIIFGETFGRPEAFPYIFGGLAGTMGVAMLVNARIVSRFGTTRLAHGVLVSYVLAATALAALAQQTDGRPPLWAFILGLAVMLSAQALIIPNFNSIAMTPMGAVAGTASSVIGATQIAVGAFLGSFLDRAFDGTVRPLSFGFVGFGLLALVLVIFAEHGRLFRPYVTPSPRSS
jgi:MFS transporter, DHA1 family, multidrug resistance protein